MKRWSSSESGGPVQFSEQRQLNHRPLTFADVKSLYGGAAPEVEAESFDDRGGKATGQFLNAHKFAAMKAMGVVESRKKYSSADKAQLVREFEGWDNLGSDNQTVVIGLGSGRCGMEELSK